MAKKIMAREISATRGPSQSQFKVGSRKITARKISAIRGPSQRQLKVGEHIRHMLSIIIQRSDFHDPILSQSSINISQVIMSPDLRHARIYILPLKSLITAQVVEALNKHSYLMRQQIRKNLTMKFLPRLFFVEDDLIDTVTRLDELFLSPHVMQDLKKL